MDTLTNGPLFIYLLVQGSMESHTVLSAHLSLEHAEKAAEEWMKRDPDPVDWEPATPYGDREVEVWEQKARPESKGHSGRMFAYYAIECFEVQDDGVWTLDWRPSVCTTAD